MRKPREVRNRERRQRKFAFQLIFYVAAIAIILASYGVYKRRLAEEDKRSTTRPLRTSKATPCCDAGQLLSLAERE